MTKMAGVQGGKRLAGHARARQARRSDRRFPRPVRLAIMLVVPAVLWAAAFIAVRALF